MARVLFLAPQPFYQERGTPIAIDLALRVLSEEGHDVDLVTYPEGEPRAYARLEHRRLPRIPGVHHVPPGFSWKKLLYSTSLAPFSLRQARRRRYDLVHAVEEAVFVARGLKTALGLPYVYDMDSSVADQLVEKKRWLRPLAPAFASLERRVIRDAAAVLAVCPALVDRATAAGARRVVLLQDISLLDLFSPGTDVADLREELGRDTPLLVYVGNLERYQGIDLLLQGLAQANRTTAVALAVVGGAARDVARYREMTAALGIAARVRFFGPRPLRDLGAYLAQADIVVSPRITGNNTPMKIYTYLDAGRALLATRIESHTQVLEDQVAYLVDPEPEAMAAGILRLAADPALRQPLAGAAQQVARERHRWPAYRRTLADAYTWILEHK